MNFLGTFLNSPFMVNSRQDQKPPENRYYPFLMSHTRFFSWLLGGRPWFSISINFQCQLVNLPLPIRWEITPYFSNLVPLPGRARRPLSWWASFRQNCSYTKNPVFATLTRATTASRLLIIHSNGEKMYFVPRRYPISSNPSTTRPIDPTGDLLGKLWSFFARFMFIRARVTSRLP